MERNTPILGMNGAIVSKEKVAADERTSALKTFERALLGVCQFRLAAIRVIAVAECLEGGGKQQLQTMTDPAHESVGKLSRTK